MIYCTKEFLFLADSFYECKSWGFIRGRTPLLPPFNLTNQVKGRRGSCLCKNRVTYFLYRPHLIFRFQFNKIPAQSQILCGNFAHNFTVCKIFAQTTLNLCGNKKPSSAGKLPLSKDFISQRHQTRRFFLQSSYRINIKKLHRFSLELSKA